MPITEIPPRSPVPSSKRPESGEMYDANRWESAYRDLHVTPELVVQLQDDLSRSRQREAFWISLIVHILLIIVILNSNYLQQFLGKFFPKSAAVIAVSPELQQKKDLTYLELPPDLQKITKPPKTNIISDKNRIAESRSPKIDKKELQKILDSARAGRRGPVAPAVKPQSPSPPAAAQQQQPAPQQQQQAQQQPPQPKPNQMAAMQPPARPAPSFRMPNLSAGSAIEQAARAAAANRGSFEGDGGDFGLDQGRQAPQAFGNLDVLSDTMGVDFGPYLARVLHDVRENWYRVIPESARPPLMKKGKVSIEFAITKDGRVAGMRLSGTSGDVALDRAAWAGITASNPFPPLPTQFGGQYLALRFHFYYNPDARDLQ